jgi:crossover junction endodeoxyribonuclease RusA
MMETRKQAPRGRKRPAKARSPRQAPEMPHGRPPVIQQQGDAIACYLDQPPSANRWWRNVRGRMVLSREAREYKAMVATLAQMSRAKPFPLGTPVRFQMHWHRGRKSGDLDKRLGVLLDALQGVAYENDSQIVEIAATRDDVPYAFAVVVHITPLRSAPAGVPGAE